MMCPSLLSKTPHGCVFQGSIQNVVLFTDGRVRYTRSVRDACSKRGILRSSASRSTAYIISSFAERNRPAPDDD